MLALCAAAVAAGTVFLVGGALVGGAMRGSASSLPVKPTQEMLEHEESDPRGHATLPVGSSQGLDMHTAELEPHFTHLQLMASTKIYRTKIDCSCLHMKITNRDTGATYVALLLPYKFTPTMAIVRPHVSLVHNVRTAGWQAYYHMKHSLTTLLNQRDITCYFRTTVSHPYKFVIDENCELGVLARMLQAIIRNYHPANHPIDIVQELHFTFEQLGYPTV